MQAIEDLPTPSVLVDLDVLEKNVRAMQDRARSAGVKLRPHAKTHKSPEVARLQLSAGASGLTLAKTSEAEVFAALGFDDVFLGYPVFGADKARRLLVLADKVRLAVGVDSLEGARSLASVFHAAGRRLPVRLKIDCGYHRVGVPPETAVETARRIADVPGLEFAGVFTHGGQGYAGRTPEEVAEAGHLEGRVVAETADAIRAAGLPVDEVSLGSTPTVRAAISESGVTECRPGTYVYNDFSQVQLGSAKLEDCAMTVVATIVSAPAADRAVCDAGSRRSRATLSVRRARATGGSWDETAASPVCPRSTASSGWRPANPSGSASACGSCRTTPASCRICTIAWSPSAEAASRARSPLPRAAACSKRRAARKETARRLRFWPSLLVRRPRPRRPLPCSPPTRTRWTRPIPTRASGFATSPRRCVDGSPISRGRSRPIRDQPAPSSVSFTIKSASIDTHNADRDKHLRSPDFFDAGSVPRSVRARRSLRRRRTSTTLPVR